MFNRIKRKIKRKELNEIDYINMFREEVSKMIGTDKISSQELSK